MAAVYDEANTPRKPVTATEVEGKSGRCLVLLVMPIQEVSQGAGASAV